MSNVGPVRGIALKALLDAFEAIWPNVFASKIANTIVCERCCRPFTYWTKDYRGPGRLRHYCDACCRTE
jgi:hypothetical protein